MRMARGLIVCLALICCTLSMGAKMTLKDGTVYEGDIKKTGGSYSVKLKDGSLKLVPAGDILSLDDPTGKVSLNPPAAAAGSAAGGAAGSTPGGTGPLTGGTDAFSATVRAAERSENPIIAVTYWQKYIDDHPAAADLDKAKAELKRWQEMADKGAEKVKGKWVTGEELKTLRAKVRDLLKESRELMGSNQTLKSVEKVQEVIKIYPNSFDAHFQLGYIHLLKGGIQQYDKAIASLETASKIKSNSPEALSNLAIAYNFRGNYEKAVTTAYKAVQIEDNQEIVQNLVNAISFAPPGMRQNNPRVRAIMEEVPVLMARHRIAGPSGRWAYLHPRERAREKKSDDDKADSGPPGVVGSGTGFFISADGYLLTNRHVAAAGDQLIIRMSDGTQKVAEKILVDEEQDIAILKIKTDKPTPFIRLAGYDSPPIGTDVTVMGFPLGAMLGSHVKITRGVVTSYESSGPECDVIVDAQVNPGNSGGPMIDKYGNLMALVAMKTFADESVSSYGLGISTGRLRKFFEKHKEKLKITLEPAVKSTTMLNTEEIAGQYTKATLMILIVSGDMPEGLK
ncbi:MAG: trypsin-like peptidase domain-containing protein [Burkholderiales bacterium]|nr:trypsin-like peptidase domain-containing protein [Phycisphaerae bacterium]